MSNTEVPLLYNKFRLRALQKALEKHDSNLEQELHQTLDTLYNQYVPADEQEHVESMIRREEAAAADCQKYIGAFGVYHLHSKDGDMHIASRKHNNLLWFAELYLEKHSSKIDSYTIDNLACFFGEYRELNITWFRSICETFHSNDAVSLIADVDFERGNFSVLQKGSADWMTYRLDDILSAAEAAFKPSGYSDFERHSAFSAELKDRELEASETPSEDAGMAPQL